MGFHQWWLGFQMVFMTRMGIGFFINILFLTHLLIPRCFSCFIFCLLLISHPWTRNNSFKDSWLTRLTQLHQCRGLPFKPHLGVDFSAEHLLGAAVRWSDIQLITSYIIMWCYIRTYGVITMVISIGIHPNCSPCYFIISPVIWVKISIGLYISFFLHS